METTKYPRTYHLPFSEGLQNDDRKVDDDWWEYLKDKTLVLTEKLDGEYWVSNGSWSSIDIEYFPEVTFENSPQELELKLI